MIPSSLACNTPRQQSEQLQLLGTCASKVAHTGPSIAGFALFTCQALDISFVGPCAHRQLSALILCIPALLQKMQ